MKKDNKPLNLAEIIEDMQNSAKLVTESDSWAWGKFNSEMLNGNIPSAIILAGPPESRLRRSYNKLEKDIKKYGSLEEIDKEKVHADLTTKRLYLVFQETKKSCTAESIGTPVSPIGINYYH